jgi:hypothetical protein
LTEPDRAQDRTHVDDRPAAVRQHRRDLVAHRVEDAVEVHGHDLAPTLEGIVRDRRRRTSDAGIVDRDVQAAVLGDHAVDELTDGVRVADVCHFCVGRRPDVVCHRLRRDVVDVDDDHGCAVIGEPVGDGLADAGAGTGHQSDLAFQSLRVLRHLILLRSFDPCIGVNTSDADIFPTRTI